MRSNRVVYVFCSLILYISACINKDEFNFKKLGKSDWNPHVAAPLIDAKFIIADILERIDKDGDVLVNEDNFATLVYHGNLISQYAEDILRVPDQSFYFSTGIEGADTISFIPQGMEISYDSLVTVTFDPGGGAQIDSMIYKDGFLQVNFDTDIQHDISILMEIPCLIKNGVPFSEIVNLPYSGGNSSFNQGFDLRNYHFDLTRLGTGTNWFDAKYSITLTGTGNGLSSTDNINMSATFANVFFNVIYGDVGSQLLSPDMDTVKLRLFNDALHDLGSFSLVDPKVTFIIRNSYGVPIEAGFEVLEGYSFGTPAYSIGGSGIPNPLPIYTPTISQIGQALEGSFTLTKDNSNIATLINMTPENIVYQFYSETNPTMNPGINFVLDTSHFDVDVELELPLFGAAEVFTVKDTFPFNFESAELFDDLILRTWVSNGFPFNVNIQLYFLDEEFNAIDSLIKPEEPFMISANVNALTGRVTEPHIKSIDSHLDKTALQAIKNAKHLVVTGSTTTTNNGMVNVRIYTDYAMHVKLGTIAQMDMKL